LIIDRSGNIMGIDEIVTAIHDSTLAEYVRGDVPGTEWLFPIIETLHILCLTIVFGSIAMIDMRLLGLVNRQVPFTNLYRELVPWTWWAFAGAAVSGSILATGKIQDYVHSPQFMAKFMLIALAGVNMVVFHAGTYRDVAYWDKAGSTPAGARLAGTLSLTFWIAVIFCGRWVGFVT
jgi:hypothetical protein